MQLKSLRITDLFGRLSCRVDFPIGRYKAGSSKALVILHGPNGIGKTTVLRMLHGLMQLDFTVFRNVPFSSAELFFTKGKSIAVKSPRVRGSGRAMEVAFGDRSVELSGEEPGPYAESERSAVDEFRRKFLYATRGIHFELLEADRVSPAGAEAELGYDRGRHSSRLERVLARQRRVERGGPYSSRIPVSEWSAPLSRRVAQFISEAQAYHRSFFQIEEPSLIRRLIEVITEDEEGVVEIGELRDRADQLRREDKRMSALGLASIRFSHEELENYIVKLGRWRKGERRERAEAVIRAYIEVLESRFAERASLASRLLTFEKVMANFLEGKVVTLAGRKGLVIKDALGGELRETQLSSGEQHLLYLMVAALVARREGTVIAIDEPELSMHLAWQRKLVPALFECSSGASPLFILATHSPDIAASYPNALVDIRNKKLARK